MTHLAHQLRRAFAHGHRCRHGRGTPARFSLLRETLLGFGDACLMREGVPTTGREWCVPEELLNRFPRRLLTDEEI
jgi:hypothetical protein